ncbi:hypothetical protein K435DRAFT_325255 [Dendrothele bispora CBS 962.96]|uniref:Cytochrome P450 n=1 Tax=Dendrothele bispora (strain CBS 962.96) TaxID=1314807 RepID=A0A4S8LFU3_DENBC|nr:hypothetical protein K435DRAFT_325255 [Dendrothele bispora CBS 962.96]
MIFRSAVLVRAMDITIPEQITTGWNTIFLVASGVSFLWVLQNSLTKFLSLQRAFQVIKGVPGGELLWFHPFRSAAPVLAPYFPSKGRIGNYYSDYKVYAKYGSTILGSVKFWGGVPTFWVSDPDALKTISNNRNIFRRDLEGVVRSCQCIWP